MIDAVIDWFRSWVVSSRRYRSALNLVRNMERMSVKEQSKSWDTLKTLQSDIVELEEVVGKEESRANEMARTLHDDRKHFQDELKDRDNRLERLESDLGIMTSERDQQILINERDKARVESETAKFVAERVRYLSDQNRPPDEGLI